MVGAISQVQAKHNEQDCLVHGAQLLDEHHLVAWSRNLAFRERFGLELAWFLQRLPQTEVVAISGQNIRDIGGLCTEFDHALTAAAAHTYPGTAHTAASSVPTHHFHHNHRPMAHTIDGDNGLIAHLRLRSPESAIRGDADIIKRRYYVWRDADILLRFDAKLFGQAVDALCGVSAEAEYASEDRLLIHRAVFVGGPALDLYAEDPAGQFRSWLKDSSQQPLWKTISGLKSPPMMRYALV